MTDDQCEPLPPADGEDDGEDRRRWTDRRDIILSVISIFLTIGMFVWVHSQGQDLGKAQGNIKTEQQTLSDQQRALALAHQEIGITHKTLLNGCDRLNRQYVQENRTALANFELFALTLNETKAAERLKTIPPQQRASTRSFLKRLEDSVRNETWTPLADCKRQVDLHGSAYRTPEPVPFTLRLPTKAALSPPKLKAKPPPPDQSAIIKRLNGP